MSNNAEHQNVADTPEIVTAVTAVMQDIAEVQGAVVEFDRVAAGIAELRAKFGGVVFDVRTTKGMQEACAARMEVRAPRYAADKVLAAAKRPLNDMKRNLTARHSEIVAQLLEVEAPIDEQIKAEEQRKADEKARKEREERERIASIQQRIEGIRRAAIAASAPLIDPDGVREIIAGVEAEVLDESLGEFRESAERAKSETLTALRDILAGKVAAEAEAERMNAEQARMDAERAELARQQAEIARQQAEIARQRAEIEEANRQRAEAEAAEREARERAEREAAEKEAAEHEAQARARREAAEREEVERRKAEQARIAAEQEEVERKRRDAVEAEQRRVGDAITALQTATGLPQIMEAMYILTGSDVSDATVRSILRETAARLRPTGAKLKDAA